MGLLGLAVVAGLVYAFMSAPVDVEVGSVSRGPLVVTVNEDGKTRIRERYIVSAPLAGRLERIELRPGDRIEAGKTLLSAIEPTAPDLLDERALAEAEARVGGAQAALGRAGVAVQTAVAELEFAQTEHRRLSEAVATGSATAREVEVSALMEQLKMQQRDAAVYARDIAKFELEQAQSALLRTRPEGDAGSGRLEISAPVSGLVLRVFMESAAVVTPGAPLVELGDPSDLEVEVDVLTTDAVQIQPGARVDLEGWGGEHSLAAVVRLVEPSAFTKISALGVEEQRVNVIADLVGPLAERVSLGDNYRVDARIVVWERTDVLKCPTGALFRDADGWAVFAVGADGRATRRGLSIGRRSDLEAEVLGGLGAGDRVVLHPGDTLRDGIRVKVRPAP